MSPVSVSYLGIPGYIIFWVSFIVAFGLFLQRSYFLYRVLRAGKPENRFDRMGMRIRNMLIEVVPQWCNLRTVTWKDLAGIGHAMMFWGFSLFFISYIIFIGLAGGFGAWHLIEGSTFQTVYFSILDIAGTLVVISILFAVIRRYIVKPPRLEPSGEAAIILALVLSLMLLNVVVEGFGYASQKVYGSWPLLGAALANSISNSNLSQGTIEGVYHGSWWLHYIIILGFMFYIPRSKHLHILTSPINAIFKASGHKVLLQSIPIEETENFGAAKIQDYTWKDLLDLYSCAVCGRCHVNCPAQLSGKTLSPREVILSLKEHLLENGPELISAKAKVHATDGSEAKVEPSPAAGGQFKLLAGGIIAEDDIWACTTCGACQEVCPVDIEHVRKIIELRRNLTLAQNKMPETVQVMLRNMQSRGHPWAGVQSLRLRGDWTNGLDIKILTEGVNTDTLFWVGCTGALIERNVQATLAMTRVLKMAGIDFGVLGDAETCCGDPARRAGYEFQFQLMAEQNIEMFKSHNIKEIITTCPHCFNTMKNEYPKFGGNFKVVHYTKLIADLMKQGKLKPIKQLSYTMTYHDACYLGRYNGIYQEPRQVLQSVTGSKPKEMEHTRNRNICCGGGGGHMWIEEQAGTVKINQMRTEEVIKTHADTVVTACPYCLQMFEDAIEQKHLKESLKARDIVEIVEEATKQS